MFKTLQIKQSQSYLKNTGKSLVILLVSIVLLLLCSLSSLCFNVTPSSLDRCQRSIRSRNKKMGQVQSMGAKAQTQKQVDKPGSRTITMEAIPAWAPVTFGVGSFFVLALCPVGCVAARLASVHQMAVATHLSTCDKEHCLQTGQISLDNKSTPR